MRRILLDGGLLSLVASVYLLMVLRFNPRMFLRHFAKEIRDVVPPRTGREQIVSLVLGLLIGVPLGSGFAWRIATLESRSFWNLFGYAFGVLFIFNLVDLVILDWVIVCWWAPHWVVIPGTENVVVPSQYFHHFRGFLVGTFALAVVGLIVAGVCAN